MDRFDSVGELFRERVEAQPDTQALVFEGGRFTAADLYDRACRFAHLPGAGDRSRVGLLSDAGPDAVAAFLGCALSGAVFVGLDPQRKGLDLTEDLSEAEVDLLIVEPKYAPSLDDATLDHYVQRGRFLAIDREAPAGLLEPQESLEAALAVCRHDDPDLVPEPPETLAIFAPGSDVWSHGRMLRDADAVVGQLELARTDAGWCGLGPSSPALFASFVLPSIACGATMILGRQPSASRFLHEASDERCTWLAYERPMLADVLAHDPLPDLDLRVAIGAGETSDVEREFASAFGCRIAQASA